MDDELDAADARRLLARMADDEGLRASWQRYHLIRQGLRGESALLADDGFAQRFSRRMESEPVFLRPRHKRREWLKPVGGLALAAAISALAVLGMKEYGVGPLPYSSDSWVAAGGVGEVQQAGNGLLSPEKLNEYLIMHHEGVHSAGADDMLPQSRVVSIVTNPPGADWHAKRPEGDRRGQPDMNP